MPFSAAAVDVSAMSRLFSALADDVRLRIIALLSHGELCVCHIQAALDLTQSNASRHLGILRAAGVVTHERRDRWVHYRLATQVDADCARHLRALVSGFAKQDLLRQDVEKLLKSRGPDSCR